MEPSKSVATIDRYGSQGYQGEAGNSWQREILRLNSLPRRAQRSGSCVVNVQEEERNIPFHQLFAMLD